ncbi:MAG TPA: hypothetical protein PLE74_05365 [Candidatus Cloacimonadota bacterium]|nr:hypothetical protein [Candidatus Cloacimonadota bacterium]
MSERFWFYFIFSTVVMTASYFVCIYAVGMTTRGWIFNIWLDVLLTILGLNFTVLLFGGWDYMKESRDFQLPIGMGLAISLLIAIIYSGLRIQFRF